MASLREEFEEWWSGVWRKVGKGDVWKAWQSLHKKGELPEIGALIEARDKQIAAGHFGPDRNYWPYPATWLRAWRWDDEVVVKTAPSPFPDFGQDNPQPGMHGRDAPDPWECECEKCKGFQTFLEANDVTREMRVHQMKNLGRL